VTRPSRGCSCLLSVGGALVARLPLDERSCKTAGATEGGGRSVLWHLPHRARLRGPLVWFLNSHSRSEDS
jgi:hypothetical protein